MNEKIVYTVEDIKQLLDIGIHQAYALVKSRPFPVIQIGKKFIIPKDEFHNWLNGRKEQNDE